MTSVWWPRWTRQEASLATCWISRTPSSGQKHSLLLILSLCSFSFPLSLFLLFSLSFKSTQPSLSLSLLQVDNTIPSLFSLSVISSGQHSMDILPFPCFLHLFPCTILLTPSLPLSHSSSTFYPSVVPKAVIYLPSILLLFFIGV